MKSILMNIVLVTEPLLAVMSETDLTQRTKADHYTFTPFV